MTTLVAQTVKNLPAMQETRVLSLGWEDPWRRKWLPTPVFLPGKFHGQRSLVGYSPWSCKRVGHDLVTKQQLQQIFIWPRKTLKPGAGTCASGERALRSLELRFTTQSKISCKKMVFVTFFLMVIIWKELKCPTIGKGWINHGIKSRWNIHDWFF